MTKPEHLEEIPIGHVELVPLCVILARKDAQSQWADYIWEPVSVMLDPPPNMHGKIHSTGPDRTEYFIECEPLELHRKDAPAYRENFQMQERPSLWVVLNDEDDAEADLPFNVHLVTASPYEAQDYLDSGELVVGTIEMPETLRLFLEGYIDACPPEEEFIKRKQKRKYHEDHTFGQQPLHEVRALADKARNND